MNDLVGKSIDRYHFVEKLGKGGMATVYKAFDTRLERDVAIKIINARNQDTEVFLKRFDREAKALARLSHPNIVRVHDYGEHEGKPYLVMEYLPGGTLKDKMGRPMDYKEAVRLLIPISEALHFAHRTNIIHRDIKPANILITASGNPMLSDFGIAKVLEADPSSTGLTGEGVGIGTPEYMSPEQGQGLKVDLRTDIYSLGIVLYELITGKKPFSADTPMAVVIKHMSEPLPRPIDYVPDLPEAVEQVIFKALSKEPENRYHDMDAFTKALRRLLVESPSTAAKEAQTVFQPDGFDRSPTHGDATRVDPQFVPGAVLPEPIFQMHPESISQPPYPYESQYPAAPTPKKKTSRWLLMGGGVILLGICVVIVVIGYGIYVFSNPSDDNNDATITLPVALITTKTPTLTATLKPEAASTETPIPTHTQTSPPGSTFYGPELASRDAVQAELEKTSEDRITYLFDISTETRSYEGTKIYNTNLDQSEPLLQGWGWCTTTSELLDQNLEHTRFEFTLNGVDVPEEYQYGRYYTGGDEDSPCYSEYIIVDHWTDGDHELIVAMHIDEEIDDGWDIYQPSITSNIFYVSVNQ
ncbi:MAG: protein kinase [Anaerolineaceae bacterium]|nr:protein kinase [Anaerolineaceae bacterium]